MSSAYGRRSSKSYPKLSKRTCPPIVISLAATIPHDPPGGNHECLQALISTEPSCSTAPYFGTLPIDSPLCRTWARTAAPTKTARFPASVTFLGSVSGCVRQHCIRNPYSQQQTCYRPGSIPKQ